MMRSKLCITHGGFTTILDRDKCARNGPRLGSCRWVLGRFMTEEVVDALGLGE